MKIIKETLLEFHKGSDPITSLGLGVYEKIKKKLDEIYTDEGYSYLDYKIVDLNHIEIFYKQEHIENSRNGDKLAKYKWTMKYIVLPKYTLNERNHSYTLYDRKFNEHTLSVYETNIYFPYQPNNDNIKYEKVFDIGEFNGEGVKEMGDVIIEALNKNYEPVWGFELVEFIKPENTNS